MSEALTVTGSSTPVTIYGTFAAAKDYILSMFGATYDAWAALATDDIKKRTLIAATRYLESMQWDATTAPDFATRDAIAAFPQATYELAVLIADDATLTQGADTGTNIRAVGAGSARVEFFAPQSLQIGNATTMPPLIMRLVGQYLASTTASTGDGALGQAGDCESPFDDEAEYRRWWAF